MTARGQSTGSGLPAALPAPPIRWRRGPLTLQLAGAARLRLPPGMIAAEGGEMRRFLSATGNQLTGKELAVAGREDLRWFAVISLESTRGAPTSGRREEWTEDSVEADGRKVRIRTVAVPAGPALLSFEVVSELADAAAASVESDGLIDRLEIPDSGRPPLGLLPPALAALACAAYCVYWVILRRQRRR